MRRGTSMRQGAHGRCDRQNLLPFDGFERSKELNEKKQLDEVIQDMDGKEQRSRLEWNCAHTQEKESTRMSLRRYYYVVPLMLRVILL